MITISYKRLLSILLSISLSLTPIYASEPNLDSGQLDFSEAGGTHTLPMQLEVEALNFSVSVPTALPVYIDVNGNSVTADNVSIVNNSNKDIQVSGITLTPASGWALKAYDSELGDNQFGVMINSNKSGNGTFTWSNFRVAEGVELPLTYDIKVKEGLENLTKTDVATVTMVLDWFSRVEGVVYTGDELYDGSTMISMGESFQLETPATYSMRSISEWSSSNEEIATISENGIVTAIKPGRVTMTYGDTEVPLHIYGTQTSIGQNFFNNTTEGIVIPEHYEKDGVWYTVTSIAAGASGFSWSNFKTIELPDTLISIGAGAFDRAGLVSIVIPESVTSIHSTAFNECSMLSSIVIPSSVTLLDFCAFQNCTSLQEVKIYSNITSLPRGIFGGCKNLGNVYLPSSIVNIEQYAFEKVTTPFNIHFEGTASEWSAINVESFNTILSSCTKNYEVSY